MELQESQFRFISSGWVRILLHISFWLAYFGTFAYILYLLKWWDNATAVYLIMTGCNFVLVYYLLVYFLHPRFSDWRNFPWLLGSLLVLQVYLNLTDRVFVSWYNTVSDDMVINPYMQFYSRLKWYDPLTLLITVVRLLPPYVIKLFRDYSRMQANHLLLQKEKSDLELNFLKTQLDPHFLLNTLNNIYALSLSDAEKAPDSIIRLSDQMRYMLYESNTTRIPLEREVKFIEDYIELEKLRYAEEVQITFEKEGTLQHRNVAPLLFVSFIENAFKHGVAITEIRSSINIQLKVFPSRILFTIENTKPPQNSKTAKASGGIGVENSRKRLKLLYPDKHQLDVIDTGKKFKVLLVLFDEPVNSR